MIMFDKQLGATDGHIRFCLITNDLEIGGVQRVLVDLCDGMDKSRFQPEIILVCGEGPHVKTIRQLGCPVHYVPCIVRCGRLKLPSIFGVFRLVRLLKSRDYRLVHTHLFFGNMFGRMAALLARIPVIIASEHNTYLDKPLWRRLLDRMLARKTTLMVAVTKAVADFTAEQEDIPRQLFEVIANGIDAEYYGQAKVHRESVRHSLGIAEDALVIGTIGRLVPQKNLTVLLEAAADIFARHRNISLLIVGDGCQRSYLEDITRKRGLSARVIFAGAHLDVRPFLSVMDIFAHTPRYEGFGLVLLEAMAAGVPIIAHAVGGIREVIENNKSGILIDDCTTQALTNAIETLIFDSIARQRLIDEGYRLVSKRFSRQRMVHKYQGLYERLLKQANISSNAPGTSLAEE